MSDNKSKHICIIGGGTYGSYIAHVMGEKHPDFKITILEVGSSTTKSESEIGYHSTVKGFDYKGLTDGRFFGFGGSSAKWGGQLLFFSEKDFANPDPFLKDIVDLNIKFKDKVYSRFLNWTVGDKESDINDRLFVKNGLWLSYFKRNLFYHFKILKQPNIEIIENSRVVKIEMAANEVSRILYKKDGETVEYKADFYYLTAGAFESNRLLMDSSLIDESIVSFSDHISQRAFKIKGGTKIGDVDFGFKVKKGASLFTKRLVGEVNDVSYFVNPIFNSDFVFFQNIKRLLFKREINWSILKSTFQDLPSVFAFAYGMLVKKELYVYKNEWYLQIDVESANSKATIQLSEMKDKFGERGLDLNVEISEGTREYFDYIKKIISDYLVLNNVDFKVCNDVVHADKLEDTYHPYRIQYEFKSKADYFEKYRNLLIVNTGILSRVGGINPTAALFPLLEEHISTQFNN